jgi:hypothetical protein
VSSTLLSSSSRCKLSQLGDLQRPCLDNRMSATVRKDETNFIPQRTSITVLVLGDGTLNQMCQVTMTSFFHMCMFGGHCIEFSFVPDVACSGDL